MENKVSAAIDFQQKLRSLSKKGEGYKVQGRNLGEEIKVKRLNLKHEGCVILLSEILFRMTICKQATAQVITSILALTQQNGMRGKARI